MKNRYLIYFIIAGLFLGCFFGSLVHRVKAYNSDLIEIHVSDDLFHQHKYYYSQPNADGYLWFVKPKKSDATIFPNIDSIFAIVFYQYSWIEFTGKYTTFECRTFFSFDLRNLTDTANKYYYLHLNCKFDNSEYSRRNPTNCVIAYNWDYIGETLSEDAWNDGWQGVLDGVFNANDLNNDVLDWAVYNVSLTSDSRPLIRAGSFNDFEIVTEEKISWGGNGETSYPDVTYVMTENETDKPYLEEITNLAHNVYLNWTGFTPNTEYNCYIDGVFNCTKTSDENGVIDFVVDHEMTIGFEKTIFGGQEIDENYIYLTMLGLFAIPIIKRRWHK